MPWSVILESVSLRHKLLLDQLCLPYHNIPPTAGVPEGRHTLQRSRQLISGHFLPLPTLINCVFPKTLLSGFESRFSGNQQDSLAKQNAEYSPNRQVHTQIWIHRDDRNQHVPDEVNV